MAFLSKVGNILRQSAAKQVSIEASPSKLRIFQAIRCMSSGPSSKLFIGGLSYGTDEPSLREAFAKYGEVVDARIIVDRETGRSRGFGFITYTSSEEASSAIQALDGQELHGRRVRVNYATDRRNSGSYGGGGYGGSGYGGGSYGGGGYGGGGYSGGGGGYGGGNYGGGYGENYNSNYGGGSYGENSGGFGGSNYAATGDAGGHGSNTGNYNVAGGAGGSDNFTSGLGGSDNSAGGVGGSGSFGGAYDGSSGSGFGSDGQFAGSSGDNAIDSAFGDKNQNGELEETFRDDDDADFAKRA